MDTKELKDLMEAYSEVYAPVDEAVKGASRHDVEMRKAASAERRAGDKRLSPSAGKANAAKMERDIKHFDKITKKTKPSVVGMTHEEVEQLDEVLTGSRKEKAQELIKSKQTPSGKAKPGQKEKIGLITRVAVGGPHKGLHTTYGGISPTSGKTAKGAKNIPLHGSGNKAARRAGKDVPDTRNVDEQLDIFDIVLEFLQVEGIAETLEEAEKIMANELDADDINAIVEASYSAKAARAGKDIGKPGKQFAKIAKEAGERYGSKERGEKVAGAVLAKLRAKRG